MQLRGDSSKLWKNVPLVREASGMCSEEEHSSEAGCGCEPILLVHPSWTCPHTTKAGHGPWGSATCRIRSRDTAPLPQAPDPSPRLLALPLPTLSVPRPCPPAAHSLLHPLGPVLLPPVLRVRPRARVAHEAAAAYPHVAQQLLRVRQILVHLCTRKSATRAWSTARVYGRRIRHGSASNAPRP